MQGIVQTTTLTVQLNSFVEYLRDEKKPSQNTLMAYMRDLSKFIDYADSNGIVDAADVDVYNVEDFKMNLVSMGLSAASVSRCLSALRAFFTYLVDQGIIDFNPAKSVHNAKPEKHDISVLSHKEIELLLSQPSSDDNKGIRDKAMLEVMYATGIKVSELISLDIDDINTQVGFIRVGSGAQERIIPLYALVSKYLQVYIDKSRRLLITNKNENALFVNVFGERMTRQGFWKLLKSYAAKAGIQKSITPHTIRHSFAAHLLENGADIRDISEILGHADLASTQRYTAYLKDKLKTNFIKFHPHA